ncbi:MAG: hypothetical protein AAF733_00960, partial [Verrucomicrobiota bacterium]
MKPHLFSLILALLVAAAPPAVQAQQILDEKEIQKVGNWRIVAFGKNGTHSHVMIESAAGDLRFFPVSNHIQTVHKEIVAHLSVMPQQRTFFEVWFEPMSNTPRGSAMGTFGEAGLTNGQDAYVNLPVPVARVSLQAQLPTARALKVSVGANKVV